MWPRQHALRVIVHTATLVVKARQELSIARMGQIKCAVGMTRALERFSIARTVKRAQLKAASLATLAAITLPRHAQQTTAQADRRVVNLHRTAPLSTLVSRRPRLQNAVMLKWDRIPTHGIRVRAAMYVAGMTRLQHVFMLQ